MLKVTGQDTIIVGQPAFFKDADALLAATPVDDWKTYLKWNILRGSAGTLARRLSTQVLPTAARLSGQKTQTPRNERMSGLIDGSIGELLGQLYVEKYFTPAAKKYMVDLVNNLKVTLGDRIQRLDWMSAETKARALKNWPPSVLKLDILINGKFTRALLLTAKIMPAT
jgi:putative endopeptidase